MAPSSSFRSANQRSFKRTQSVRVPGSQANSSSAHPKTPVTATNSLNPPKGNFSVFGNSLSVENHGAGSSGNSLNIQFPAGSYGCLSTTGNFAPGVSVTTVASSGGGGGSTPRPLNKLSRSVSHCPHSNSGEVFLERSLSNCSDDNKMEVAMAGLDSSGGGGGPGFGPPGGMGQMTTRYLARMAPAALLQASSRFNANKLSTTTASSDTQDLLGGECQVLLQALVLY